MIKQKGNIFLVCTVLYVLCLFVRLAGYQSFSPVTHADEFDYFSLSSGILQGDGLANDGVITAWRTPGYPLFLSGLRLVVGDNIISLRTASVFVVSLIAPLIYFLCLVLFQENQSRAKKIGIIASLFWIGMLYSIKLSSSLIGEEVATLLFVLYLITCCIAIRRNSFWLILLATVLLVASIFTRGFLLFAIFSLPIVLFTMKKKAWALSSILLSVILLGSWYYRNYKKVGIFTMSTEASEIVWLGNSPFSKGGSPGFFNSRACPEGSPMYDYLNGKYPGFCRKNEVEKAKIFSFEIKNDIPGFIKRALYLAPKKTLIYFTPVSWLGFDVIYLLSFCFSIIGFFQLFKEKKIDKYVSVVLLLPVLFCLLISILSYADVRHRHPINVQIAILGGYGALMLWEKINSIIFKEKKSFSKTFKIIAV
jgi:hypothetical protein